MGVPMVVGGESWAAFGDSFRLGDSLHVFLGSVRKGSPYSHLGSPSGGKQGSRDSPSQKMVTLLGKNGTPHSGTPIVIEGRGGPLVEGLLICNNGSPITQLGDSFTAPAPVISSSAAPVELDWC